jgi:hypothetical protein
MDQREKRYGKDNCLRKRNRTVQRIIGMEKTTGKISKTTARRKRTNQEGDENEERRRTNEDANGI